MKPYIILIILLAGTMGIASSNLPFLIKKLHQARLELLKDSQASKWPKALLIKGQ